MGKRLINVDEVEEIVPVPSRQITREQFDNGGTSGPNHLCNL